MSNDHSPKFTPKQMERGRRTLQSAKQWRKDNPEAWACIVRHAADLARERQPIGVQSLIESVRRKAFVDRFGNDTRTNNSYRAVFARWLITERPEVAPFIRLRRSVFDELMGCDG